LKGVNSENLNPSSDQGKDALTASMNQMNAIDVCGYSLHYFDRDYKSRSSVSNDFLAYSYTGFSPNNESAGRNLFNGNIKDMYSASTNTDEYYVGTGFYKFEYDQLNRIKLMDLGVYSDLNTFAASEYTSSYEFDQNGNLEYLTRSTPSVQIDDFTYVYNSPTKDNRLHQVIDAEGIATVGDLATQGVDNYDYPVSADL
jgi:hypothetical protein